MAIQILVHRAGEKSGRVSNLLVYLAAAHAAGLLQLKTCLRKGRFSLIRKR